MKEIDKKIETIKNQLADLHVKHQQDTWMYHYLEGYLEGLKYLQKTRGEK